MYSINAPLITTQVMSTTRWPREGEKGGAGGGQEEPEDEEGQSLAMTKRMGNPEEASVESARGAAP
jgi:hypothetical protein